MSPGRSESHMIGQPPHQSSLKQDPERLDVVTWEVEHDPPGHEAVTALSNHWKQWQPHSPLSYQQLHNTTCNIVFSGVDHVNIVTLPQCQGDVGLAVVSLRWQPDLLTAPASTVGGE